jgi:putative endopeptidase
MTMFCLRRAFPFVVFVLASAAMSATAEAGPGEWGFDLTGMDRNVRPGDDFNRFANGAWEDRTTIPDDQVRFGPFANMDSEANERTRLIVVAIPDGSATPVDQVGKVGQLYRSFVDEAGVEARGRVPLDSELARIDAATNLDDLAVLMGQANASLGVSLFDLDLAADEDGGKGYDVYVAQGGLRLARDYYVDPHFASKLTAYREYVAKLLDLCGWTDARSTAADVVEFESKIAAASWPEERTRDPITTRNPRAIATLRNEVPEFPWQRFFEAAGLTGLKGLNLSTPSSVQQLAKIYATTPLPVLKAWLTFRTADNASPYLSKRFVDARFEFRRTTSGQATALPRWQRGMQMLNTLMGCVFPVAVREVETAER